MIIVRNLRLSFGNQVIFNDISFSVQESDRLGLFGINGSGKSTLLKIIAESQKADGGSVSIAKGKKLAYLPQEIVLVSDKTIIDEAMTVFNDLYAMQVRLAAIEKELNTTPGSAMLIDEYAQLCQHIALHKPEQKRAEATRVLQGLGFSPAQLATSVSHLSVGWKMRVVLAMLLLQRADFYLFDEPTNHLDIVAKEWFLEFLEQSSFGFIIVCHEKRFLNRTCSKIVELDRGVATFYTGDYDDYVRQKEERLAHIVSAYESQQRTLKQMQTTIDRFRASASKARMAQSMIKKMDAIERITLPPSSKNITFHFPSFEPSGRIVISVNNVGYHFGDKKIFDNATFTLERGNKIAIVAANGVGKTTLLKIIAGRLPLQSGSVECGSKTTIAIFDQDQNASLDLSRSVLDNAYMDTQNVSEQTIRTMLGSFLFGNEAIHKKARVLSGGERNRLGMVKVLLRNANCLLLDEPTNHLDIPSKDLLLNALQAYKGTILFVSHDHDFVNELATHIVELTSDGTTVYHGNYDEYLYQKKSVAQTIIGSGIRDGMAQSEKKNEQGQHEAHKKVNALEQKIVKIEREIKRIESSFADLAYGSDGFDQASQLLHGLKEEHEKLLHEWESLHG